jgi:hypothetical protein
MNAHVQIALEEIAQCEVCHNYYVRADDEEANSLAYAMATNAYKRGEFRTTRLEETREGMKAVLRDASHRCSIAWIKIRLFCRSRKTSS